jgi:UDP-N-acetyl-D-glucosamine dehydrogenase
MDSQKIVAVVGQGYVGLPLSLACIRAGWKTIGLETNETRIEEIKSDNHDLLDDESKAELTRGLAKTSYILTSNPREISQASVVVYCIPTPLNQSMEPDLSFLRTALEQTGPYVNDGALLILESTSFPGTTRKYFAQFLMENFGNCRNCFFGFSPERIDPKNSFWHIGNTPKIVAGLNDESLKLVAEFYKNISNTVIEVQSLEIAEFAKLIENSYRLINISFVNELMMAAFNLQIPLRPAIEAAKTKPFGFQAFFPSAGIGGHCIPVDPSYLNWASIQVGFPITMIERALEINAYLPTFIVDRLKALTGGDIRRILLSGVAYKQGVADTRETPAKKVLDELKKQGVAVFWQDSLVTEWEFAPKMPHIDPELSGIVILQEIDHTNLLKALESKIPILDCTGRYVFEGVTQL